LTNEELALHMLKRVDTITTQKSLADEIGFSVGKINYVLKSLINKGLIKAERFAVSDNKSKYKYLLTQKGLKEKITLTEKFIETKKKEYEELQADLKKYKQNNQLRDEN